MPLGVCFRGFGLIWKGKSLRSESVSYYFDTFHRTGSARVFIVRVNCLTYARVFILYRAIRRGKPQVSEGIWPHDLFPL